MPGQWLKSIEIEGYRNIKSAKADFSENINVIFGENAQGKTNFIEAVWLLSGGKSFRGTKDKDMIGFRRDNFRIEGIVHSENRDDKITVACSKKNPKFSSRMAKIGNGEYTSPSKIAGNFYCVVFSPIHLNIIGGGPGLRRKFADACLCQMYPSFMDSYRKYNHVLAARNTFLKNIKRYDRLQQEAVFDSYDSMLSALGGKIYRQRENFCRSLQEYAGQFYSRISAGREQLEFEYKFSADSRRRLLEKLTASRERDVLLGYTSVGVHREDISVKLNGTNAKEYASQGQQRSIVIAMKLAESRIMEQVTGFQPRVLLDDVLSELDFGRQDYLLNNVSGRQVFITSCDADRIKLSQSKKFYVKEGIISQCM